jgi:predicted nucleic acid-binding protein
MIAEAVAKGVVAARNAVRRLAENPDLVRALTQYQDNVNKITQMRIDILNFTVEHVLASAEVRKTEGRLTNDSFIVAVMRNHGITKLATANGDFDQISGLETYKPTNL